MDTSLDTFRPVAPCSRRARQRGITMIEVLVSILILSFGLFGLLGLMTKGMQMTSSAQYRTIAGLQLSAMADILASNINPDINYTALSATQTRRCLTQWGCATPITQVANNDYYLWQQNLATLLPSGKGVVCLDATPADGDSANFACSGSGRLTVKICWNENARIGISGGGGSTISTSTDTCLSEQL